MIYAPLVMPRRAVLLSCTSVAACGGNVNIAGIYFAPWMACVAGGGLVAYAATRLLERHLFDYDPRYFAWAFLPLTVLFAFAFWLAFAHV